MVAAPVKMLLVTTWKNPLSPAPGKIFPAPMVVLKIKTQNALKCVDSYLRVALEEMN